ncbi:MAG: restriction endonuclease [Candidatus Thiodiazotropha sp. (ex Monitilora ramsayi)]|nr:restriction endonuclease [Candidatus Thiodiazotropha sp. (ex Monitilora ramsayi)]
MNYDFSRLNDKEFEFLVCDLLSSLYGKRVERFKAGRDGGVDGRFYCSGKEVILQCKHYIKTGYKGLIRRLKNDEKQKVIKLKPKKYIFITSLPLSRHNKKEIQSIFTPFIENDQDVFGQEDLNELLAKYPDVEERHFKLWISSTSVLTRIINNAIKGRSECELDEIQKRSCKYVQTDDYPRALEIIKKNKVLIISGEPGIGKTTLAENICLYYSSKNYEFIDIEESLTEAESIFKKGKKQIFYFDDFLGSNYFEAIENKKDSHVVKFINRIKSDNKKIFVLTSRTNILISGVHHSSVFSNKNIQKDEYLLSIKSLNPYDRAKILYNHIWFSGLSEEFIDEIYKNKRYHKIIKHQNYNPRLIEFITDVARIGGIVQHSYWEYIEGTLKNPKDIWSNCFKVQNNEYVRSLVNLIVFNGGNIKEEELTKSYYKIIELEHIQNISNTEKDFVSISALATRTFIQRHKKDEEFIYTLFNPSISDYVLNEYCQDLHKLTNIFKSLGTIQSLHQLTSLGKGRIVNFDYVKEICLSIFNENYCVDRTYDYQVFIAYQLTDDENYSNNIKIILQKIIIKPDFIKEFSKFLSLLTIYYKDLEIADQTFLYNLISNRYLDEEEINDLANYIFTFGVEDQVVIDELNVNIKYHLKDELETHLSEIDLSEFVDVSYDAGDEQVDYDVNRIKEEVISIADNIVETYPFELLEYYNYEQEEVIDEIDIDELVSDYLSSLNEPDIDDHLTMRQSHDCDIDDLFERT